MHRSKMTKSKIINYLVGLLLIAYYLICIRNSYLQIVTFKNGWYLGEWIINYQDGGFKRRGLFGSLFIFVNEMTAILLEYIVFAFVFLIYTTFFYLLFTLFWKKKNSLLTLSLLLLPSGLGMLLKDPTVAAKKDIFFLVLFLMYFMALRARIIINDMVVSVLIIVCILNHEAAFFYLPSVSYIFFIYAKGSVSHKIKRIAFFQILPALFTLFLLYRYGFSIRTPDSLVFLKNHGLVLGQLGIYEYDPAFDVISFYKKHLYGYELYSISILISSFTFLIYYRLNKLRISSIFLVFQLLCLLPLFYLAYDWGRWLNILFTVLTIIAGSEKTAEDTWSKDAVAILIIIFNSLWSTMVLHLGFVSFPVIDLFLKKLFYFLYFKLKNIV